MDEILSPAAPKTRYLNLFSDRAFKAVFGSEQNKEITQAFLNSVLGEYGPITDLTFVKTDYAARNPEDRGIAVDLQCKTPDGRRVVVELQKKRQTHFRERSLFYATWPIQAQGKRGQWDYGFDAVYVVSILDFLLDEDQNDQRLVRKKMLLDTDTHEPWTSKLVFFNLEVARFGKTLNDCENPTEKWFYVLKNLHKLLERPAHWQEAVFHHLFEVTDKTRFDENEVVEYESSETEYAQMKYALEYAINEGRAEGRALGIAEGKAEGFAEGKAEGKAEGMDQGLVQAKLEIARNMKSKGMEIHLIVEVTGLDLQTMEKL